MTSEERRAGLVADLASNPQGYGYPFAYGYLTLVVDLFLDGVLSAEELRIRHSDINYALKFDQDRRSAEWRHILDTITQE